MLMKDIIDAFKFIGEAKQGSAENLIKNIGFETYRHLIALRFIKEYQDADNPEKLWKITKAGKAQKEFYREPTAAEKEDGRFLDGLGI